MDSDFHSLLSPTYVCKSNDEIVDERTTSMLYIYRKMLPGSELCTAVLVVPGTNTDRVRDIKHQACTEECTTHRGLEIDRCIIAIYSVEDLI